MNSGQTFLHHLLQQSGATILADNQLRFTEQPVDYPELQQQNTITPLIHLGVIILEGPDAIKFLQGQVTCDVQQINRQKSLVGARCNPKGRALTNFYLLSPGDDKLCLVMDRALVTPSIEELAKYAAFFKVELTDASTQLVVMGLSGPNPDCPPDVCCYPIAGNRHLIIAAENQAPSLWDQLSTTHTATGTEYWRLLDINSGLGLLQAATAGMFIPQMLNFQAIEGISFTKGCYTGQEVIARMKYLGKLKRRMYLVSIAATHRQPNPGDPCYLPGQKQSVGNVVTTASADHDNLHLLLVLTDEAAQTEQLVIGDIENTSDSALYTLTILPLPYAIDS